MSMTPPGPPPSGPPPSGPPPSGPPPSGPPPSAGQQPPAAGWIQLTVQGSRMTSNFIAPLVSLNGYPVDVSYGANTYPVPPGPWRVQVHCQWMRRYGQAQLDVQVGPGQAVPLFYAPPWHQFTSGAIGFDKQPRKGLWLLLAILLVVATVAGLAAASAFV